ncbi:MAG: hypothetical protein N3G20_10130, partial [Verrucomicrobiae bacterium]|nr:hypothetical protein [Verrucomicrobiae bacterium]
MLVLGYAKCQLPQRPQCANEVIVSKAVVSVTVRKQYEKKSKSDVAKPARVHEANRDTGGGGSLG